MGPYQPDAQARVYPSPYTRKQHPRLRFGLVGASRDAGLKEGFSVTETPTACEITVRVRYAEADPMGYLHHATYFEYFEMGRTELLRQAGSRYRDLEAAGFLFVVFAVQAKYHRPARYDDELIVRTILERVTRARIDHRYEVHRDGLLLCEASTTLACVGRDGRPTGIPEELFHQLRDA